MDEGDAQFLAAEEEFAVVPVLAADAQVVADGVDAAVDPDGSSFEVVVEFLVWVGRDVLSRPKL